MPRYLILAALLVGCVTGPGMGGTGALLSADILGGTDVIGFHYVVERTTCSGEAIDPWVEAFNVNLVDGYLPGGVDVIEQSFDPDSRHLAADLFFSLDAGCYEIQAHPARAMDGDAWTPSDQCSVATTPSPVEIVDGQTTEGILLISQCNG
jgi:hypothetical protein